MFNQSGTEGGPACLHASRLFFFQAKAYVTRRPLTHCLALRLALFQLSTPEPSRPQGTLPGASQWLRSDRREVNSQPRSLDSEPAAAVSKHSAVICNKTCAQLSSASPCPTCPSRWRERQAARREAGDAVPSGTRDSAGLAGAAARPGQGRWEGAPGPVRSWGVAYMHPPLLPFLRVSIA